MVNLAEAFAARNEAPTEPVAPPAVARQQAAPAISAPPSLPILTTPPARRTMNNLSSPSGSRGGALATNNLVGSSISVAGNDNSSGLTVPTCFGLFKQFNYTTRKTATKMLIRLILHNGVTNQDIEFEWVTNRRLKLRVAWPRH